VLAGGNTNSPAGTSWLDGFAVGAEVSQPDQVLAVAIVVSHAQD